MIKLLLSAFSEFPNNDTGGANKVIYQILKGIDYHKYNVAYLSKHLYKGFSNAEDLKSKITSALSLRKKLGKLFFYNSNLYRNFVLSPFYFKRYLNSIDYFYKKLKLDKEYDIIHSHDTRAMYYLKSCKNKQKVLTIHSDGSIINTIKNYVGFSTDINKICDHYLFMENESLEIADIITFPSKAARDLFIDEKSKVNFDQDKIRIVYNGIDCNFIQNTKSDDKFISKYVPENTYDIKILNVAAHIRNKNIDKVIDSVFYLKTKYNINAVLLNAGSGPETKQLLGKCEKLKIIDQVKFLGRVPAEDIIKLLKSTDVLISVPEKVVFDMIILEGLAAGAIIIASKRGGNSEAIENGYNGYLVENLNGESFADAISKIDKEVSKNALLASRKFDISVMINEYSKYYSY